MRLLFTKPGAQVCLSIPNRHGELPFELAQRREYDELFQVLTDNNTVERYKLNTPETVELDNGACLRSTERQTGIRFLRFSNDFSVCLGKRVSVCFLTNILWEPHFEQYREKQKL